MQKTKNKIPPYVSFKTFQTFLEFLSEGMPNRIDRSVWLNKFSGSNGTQIMTAIKFFELIDINGIPSEDFKNLVSRDINLQKKVLRKLLYKYYSPIFDLDLFLLSSFDPNIGAIERAVKVLMTIAMERVIAISLNKVPLIPPINSKGAKVAKRIILVEIIAKITFLDPVTAAVKAVSPCSTR